MSAGTAREEARVGGTRERFGEGPFSQNLRAACKRRGMDADQLALLSGESQKRTRRLLSGESRPAYNEIPRFARVLRVEPAALAWSEPVAFLIHLRELR